LVIEWYHYGTTLLRSVFELLLLLKRFKGGQPLSHSRFPVAFNLGRGSVFDLASMKRKTITSTSARGI
jgi:hypothetical protein